MLHWRMVINNFLIMLRKTAGVKIVQRFVLMRSWRLLDCKSLWGLCDPFGAIWKELQGRKTSLRCFILVKERKKITECFNRKHYFYSFQIQVHLDQNCGCCLWGASTWQVWLSSCTNTYHAVASIQLQKKKKKGQIFLQCAYSHCFRERSSELSLCVLTWRCAMGRTYGEKVVHEAPVAPTLAKMLKCQYRCQGIWWKVFKLVVILLLTLSNRTVFVCFSGFIYVNYLLTFFLANFLKPIYLQVLWSLWLLYISFSITIQLSTEKLHRLYFLFVKFYFKDASKSDKTLAVRSSSEQPNYPSCTHRSIPVDFIFTGNMKGISCIQVQLRSFAIKLN